MLTTIKTVVAPRNIRLCEKEEWIYHIFLEHGVRLGALNDAFNHVAFDEALANDVIGVGLLVAPVLSLGFSTELQPARCGCLRAKRPEHLPRESVARTAPNTAIYAPPKNLE